MTLPQASSFLLVAFALASCNPKVQFEEPMPPSRPNLPNIPRAYRGTIEHTGLFAGETWQIGKDTVRLGDDILVNGEDFLLRSMAGHVVLSKPIPETGQWEVLLFRHDGEQMYVGSFDEDEAFIRRMATLLAVTPENQRSPGTPGYSYFLLNPSAKEFKTMLKEGLYEKEEQGCPLPRGGVVRP